MSLNLQQLIGELSTLALAYPAETPVRFQFRDITGDVVGVIAQSGESTVEIILEEQA